MATEIIGGPLTWSGSRDENRHRTYKVRWLIRGTADDGPQTALLTPGLPLPGSVWQFGNDFDLWAWCQFDADIKIHKEKEGDPSRYWTIDQTFSSKPKSWCQDEAIDDPLLRKAKISGGTVKYTEESVIDRFGKFHSTSSHEQIRGPQVEFDRHRHTIKIDQNVASYNQILLASQFMNCVNALPLWGFQRRQVKLSDMQWSRQFFGNCQIYFNRTLTFDASLDHDKNLPDFSQFVLNGHLNRTTGEYELVNINGQPPDPNNPRHFIKFRGLDNAFREVMLNGAGLPAGIPLSGQPSNYMSITLNNRNHPLTDTTYWLPVLGNVAPTPTRWDADRFYFTGNVVFFGEDPNLTGEGAFIALLDDSNVEPGAQGKLRADGTAIEEGGNANWKWIREGGLINNLTFDRYPPLADRGQYQATTTYDRGDYVRNPAIRLNAGIIHIEKYPEANFLLLGVPVNFSIP